MHHIYTTPAFIINSTSYGESGKYLFLFTRDLGMIGVVAQGIRLEKSKLRQYIQDYSYTSVSLIRGRDVWRLVGAYESEFNLKSNIVNIKILKLLKRLLQGEEKNQKLFDIIHNLFSNNIENSDSECLEYLSVLRILHELGYIRNDNNIEPLLKSNEINDEILNICKTMKNDILKRINDGLRESQL